MLMVTKEEAVLAATVGVRGEDVVVEDSEAIETIGEEKKTRIRKLVRNLGAESSDAAAEDLGDGVAEYSLTIYRLGLFDTRDEKYEGLECGK
ncbi:hypothetical protein L484_021371 [Morus notabilis]|uniref:Uncharacterized protein n=1 Tax=Morus notabilis TaxID=981085 RepID=W9RSZ2_9ROSA|nr:hypothetical protein L484_021371 [Morus notabilis]